MNKCRSADFSSTRCEYSENWWKMRVKRTNLINLPCVRFMLSVYPEAELLKLILKITETKPKFFLPSADPVELLWSHRITFCTFHGLNFCLHLNHYNNMCLKHVCSILLLSVCLIMSWRRIASFKSTSTHNILGCFSLKAFIFIDYFYSLFNIHDRPNTSLQNPL